MPGSLQHSPSDVLRKTLVVLGLGTMPSSGGEWPISVGLEPPKPDNSVTIYDTTGTNSGRTQVDGERQEHHGVQVRVRSTTHSLGFAKARAIAVALDQSILQESILVEESGTPQRYLLHSVTRIGDVAVLGRESPDSDRRLFTVNALMSVRQES